MPAPLPPIRLTGAVALREGQFCARTVGLARGRIELKEPHSLKTLAEAD